MAARMQHALSKKDKQIDHKQSRLLDLKIEVSRERRKVFEAESRARAAERRSEKLKSELEKKFDPFTDDYLPFGDCEVSFAQELDRRAHELIAEKTNSIREELAAKAASTIQAAELECERRSAVAESSRVARTSPDAMYPRRRSQAYRAVRSQYDGVKVYSLVDNGHGPRTLAATCGTYANDAGAFSLTTLVRQNFPKFARGRLHSLDGSWFLRYLRPARGLAGVVFAPQYERLQEKMTNAMTGERVRDELVADNPQFRTDTAADGERVESLCVGGSFFELERGSPEKPRYGSEMLVISLQPAFCYQMFCVPETSALFKPTENRTWESCGFKNANDALKNSIISGQVIAVQMTKGGVLQDIESEFRRVAPTMPDVILDDHVTKAWEWHAECKGRIVGFITVGALVQASRIFYSCSPMVCRPARSETPTITVSRVGKDGSTKTSTVPLMSGYRWDRQGWGFVLILSRRYRVTEAATLAPFRMIASAMRVVPMTEVQCEDDTAKWRMRHLKRCYDLCSSVPRTGSYHK